MVTMNDPSDTMTTTAVNTDIEFVAGACEELGRVHNINGTNTHTETEERPKPKTQYKRAPEIPIPEWDRRR